ncbi:MAG TPA: LPS assembly lipoprotein LptE [Gallionella sp.]|nr:LPS assembly lipoprotein LptE [Gallionella sp.]
MRALLRFPVLIAAMTLAACSFHLRGQAGMPFDTIYLKAANPNTDMIKELRRSLEVNKVKLVDNAQQADLILDIVSENPDKQILTLDNSGRVNEFELFYRVSLRAYDLKKQEWIPAEVFMLRRDFPYDDNNVLAMEAAEDLLNQSMRTEMVQQIVRRLSRSKPQTQSD